MRPDSIVVVAPEGDLAVGSVQNDEDLLVQQLVVQTAVEALKKAFCCGWSGFNVPQSDVVLLGPRQDGPADELSSFVADDATALP